MSDVSLEMSHVYKKFARGEKHNSLRDFVPALARSLFKGNSNGGLQKAEFWALNDISFAVRKGEAFGIIGPNGAGKSTILKLLTRIMVPTRGDIAVKGKLSALIEVGAGFHQDLTGRENIFLNGTILGMKKDEIRRKFEEIVEFSGLGDFIDTPVKRYSSGMYARLGFSVAAHVNPDILVVDEVLSVGDYLFQRKCVEKMNSIMKSGATLIFVSHDLKAVSDLCNRTLLLDKGEAVMLGATREVIQCYLNQHVKSHRDDSEKEVFISRVIIRNEKGECSNFVSGEKAFISIQVTSKVACKRLSIAIYVRDSNNYEIFDTSTERLNDVTFSPNPGETWECTFEICLHLTAGSYHLGVSVFEYINEKKYDECFPAGTIFITSDSDVRGGANLYPRMLVLKLGAK